MCEQSHKSSAGCRCQGGILRGFIQPKLLLQLAKQPAHGYELIETLGRIGDLASADSGNLYRILRSLEDDGFVCSNWDTDGAGPARRIYELTESGLESLEKWVANLRDAKKRIDDFIGEYEAHFNDDGTGNNLA